MFRKTQQTIVLSVVYSSFSSVLPPRYLTHFQAHTIFSVSVEHLRGVYNLLRACEWSNSILVLQGLKPETIDRIDRYLNVDENGLSSTANGGGQNTDNNEQQGGSSSSSAVGTAASTTSAAKKRVSFRSFMTQGPRIPKSTVDALAAPANVTRNFPPAINAECHLFHYLSKFKLDWAIQKAFQTMALARPLPRLVQFKAAFLRGYLVEYVRPILLEPLLLSPQKPAFLKELVFMGLRLAYDNRSSGRTKRKEEAALQARQGGRGAYGVDAGAPARRASLNFLAPQNFRRYPLEKDKYDLKQPVVHCHAGEGAGAECYEIASASLMDPNTNETEFFYIRPEDIHFHNLFVDRCAVEYLFYFAKLASEKLTPKEDVVDEFSRAGAAFSGLAAGFGQPEPGTTLGGEESADQRSLASRVHCSVGPCGLLQALPKNSAVFPNLFSVEFYVDCTTSGGLGGTGSGSGANETSRSVGADVFLRAVDKLITQMFEHEEVFTPIQLFTSSDRKPISLASSEFAVESLDLDTNWIWIDTFYFLEREAIPDLLLDAKIKVGQISKSQKTEWKKPRYIRLMVYIGRQLQAQSPRYFFSRAHPGLAVEPAFFASEAPDDLRRRHEKRASGGAGGRARSISPNQLIMDFSAVNSSSAASATDLTGAVSTVSGVVVGGSGIAETEQPNPIGMKSPGGSSPGGAKNNEGGASSPLVRRTLHEQMIAPDNRHDMRLALDPQWDLPGKAYHGGGLIPLATGQVRTYREAQDQLPLTLSRNLLFGLNPWVHSVYETIVGLARCLHPPADGIFLEEKVLHPHTRENPTRFPKRALKKKKLDPHELREIARARFLTLSQHTERLCGLCDSWVHLLRHCLLDLDSIILLCSEEMGAQTTINFGALQQMWRDFRIVMFEKVLCSTNFVFPVLLELQHECLGRTLDDLESFAIPSYDADQLREWVRIAEGCRSLVETALTLVQSLWCHATAPFAPSGFSALKKDFELSLPANF